MPCSRDLLCGVPLFSNLDDDELCVLAGQVDLKQFAARQRIFRAGDRSDHAYVLLSGDVRVTALDEDQQEVMLHQPKLGEFFGFASMMEQTPHQAEATATEEATCIEIERKDLLTLFEQRPHAGIDLLAVLAGQLHRAHQLARERSLRSPNDVIDERATRSERIADVVAAFGGSWTFIISFLVVITVYTAINVALRGKAWDPYPFILLNLFLSLLAAIQAPVIIMSQNRQDKKDRVRSEMDFEVNRRSRSEIQGVAQKLNSVADSIADIEELVLRKL